MLSRKWTRICSGHISESTLHQQKRSKHKEGRTNFFMKWPSFISPQYYRMPKKRAGFIIAAYEGEVFDWELLSAEALREQLYGVKKGKPMRPSFARWFSVIFPTTKIGKPTGRTGPTTATSNFPTQKTSTTGGVARRRIDIGWYHSTWNYTTTNNILTNVGVDTKSSGRPHTYATTNPINTLTKPTISPCYTWSTNTRHTMRMTGEAKGSTLSKASARGTYTEKTKNWRENLTAHPSTSGRSKWHNQNP